ncbi:MAG: hypothetical protein QM608_10920 [Caulobacter sp.]
MPGFIETQDWPVARLVMPEQVADADAQDRLAQLKALYDRAEPFVLIMEGVELPRHSPGFMKAYAEWSMATLDLQRRWCLGAVRIEPDALLRQAYGERAAQAAKAGIQPYPYEIVDSESAARAQAARWLAAAGPAQD